MRLEEQRLWAKTRTHNNVTNKEDIDDKRYLVGLFGMLLTIPWFQDATNDPEPLLHGIDESLMYCMKTYVCRLVFHETHGEDLEVLSELFLSHPTQ